MTTTNKQNSAPTPPRLSENAMKPDPTQLLRDAGLVHHRHQEPQLYAHRVLVPNAPPQSHHHHNHHHHDYEEDQEEEDAETAAYSHAKAASNPVHNRPAINRGIAVNIAFRIVALDVDCEGYMYMLTQTGDHECGHPILPIKARGCEWRAFRDDMLTRFGWGSVLAATWLQSYNWACKVLNIEIDRILVGIDTHTPLVNAAKSRFGPDGTPDNARVNHNHSCPISSNLSSTRPSTSASQVSMSAQLGVSVRKVTSISTKHNVDHRAEPGSLAGTSGGVPSGPASVEPIKSKNSKAASSTTTSGSKTKTEKSSGIAANKDSSAKETPNSSKSERPKNNAVKEAEETRRQNPIEDIYNYFRNGILYDYTLLPTPSAAAAVTPTLKPVIIPPSLLSYSMMQTRSNTPTSSRHPPSAPTTTNNISNKKSNSSTLPPSNNSKKPPPPPSPTSNSKKPPPPPPPPSPPHPPFHFDGASASTIPDTPPNPASDPFHLPPPPPSHPSSSLTTHTQTATEATRKKKSRNRNKNKNKNQNRSAPSTSSKTTTLNDNNADSEEEEEAPIKRVVFPDMDKLAASERMVFKPLVYRKVDT